MAEGRRNGRGSVGLVRIGVIVRINWIGKVKDWWDWIGELNG